MLLLYMTAKPIPFLRRLEPVELFHIANVF